ncbi:Leader peptidase (Prepilin peptidase) (EC / N-methyltransferase (EC [Olavius sp. associated proteobacterium Delta 1]|nr:Leader peptidase (Prepilin peptidase) (EC / N-methyltransferase (EC [Olavius sp. associated proteobacterium Delta 1]
MPLYLIAIFIFIFGLCIGSFLNVCIYRIPASQSIAHPRSKCQKCDNIVAFYDNIPVFSFLWLKGRCRHCGTKIGLRYPTVELLGGLFALATFLKFGLSVEALIYFAFIACLLVVTFIDMDHRIIPDLISLPGIPICFAASFALPAVTYKAALLGIIVGGGSLFLVAWVYSLITKKEGMGGGDIKLLAMMGALVGWQGVVFTIFVSSLVGTLSGLAVMLQSGKGMKLAVPFGPFLAIGGITYIFFGTHLIDWYFNLLR